MLRAERRTTSTGGLSVRVFDSEASPGQIVHSFGEIDSGAR